MRAASNVFIKLMDKGFSFCVPFKMVHFTMLLCHVILQILVILYALHASMTYTQTHQLLLQ